MADRPCPAPDCDGQLITRDDRTIICQKCGKNPWVVENFLKRSGAGG